MSTQKIAVLFGTPQFPSVIPLYRIEDEKFNKTLYVVTHPIDLAGNGPINHAEHLDAAIRRLGYDEKYRVFIAISPAVSGMGRRFIEIPYINETTKVGMDSRKLIGNVFVGESSIVTAEGRLARGALIWPSFNVESALEEIGLSDIADTLFADSITDQLGDHSAHNQLVAERTAREAVEF